MLNRIHVLNCAGEEGGTSLNPKKLDIMLQMIHVFTNKYNLHGSDGSTYCFYGPLWLMLYGVLMCYTCTSRINSPSPLIYTNTHSHRHRFLPPTNCPHYDIHILLSYAKNMTGAQWTSSQNFNSSCRWSHILRSTVICVLSFRWVYIHI